MNFKQINWCYFINYILTILFKRAEPLKHCLEAISVLNLLLLQVCQNPKFALKNTMVTKTYM